MSDALVEAGNLTWDVVVIGGGITGAGVLREATRAGLKALLLEQRDFAWGTSSRSGKWVHGGLRYMQQGQAHVTWESVRERERLAKEAPGLIDMKPMYMPFRKSQSRRRAIMRLAMLLYDVMAGKWRHKVANKADVLRRFPGLESDGLRDALVLFEAQTDDARLTLRVIHEACAGGGTAFNYVKVTQMLLADGRVAGVRALDAESGREVSIRAKQVIAATGAWADKLRETLPRTKNERVRPLRGSHLVFSSERLPFKETIVLVHPADGRMCFAMPWQGRVVVGNTDIDHNHDVDIEAAVTPSEIDYLLAPIQKYFPSLRLGKADIIATFSGVRPVVDSGKADPSKESRDHVVWMDQGLLTIAGGKLTTFRNIARDALRTAQPSLGRLTKLRNNDPVFEPVNGIDGLAKTLDAETARRLTGRYGAEALNLVTQADPADLVAVPGTDTLWAELAWCAAHEQVRHLEDLLLRRTRIGLLLEKGGAEHFERVRHLVCERLRWTDERWAAEVSAYMRLWEECYSVPRTTV